MSDMTHAENEGASPTDGSFYLQCRCKGTKKVPHRCQLCDLRKLGQLPGEPMAEETCSQCR